MALLTNYTDFSEKLSFFKDGDMKVVINIDKIFEKLDEFHANEDFIFRGMSEAKHKLYNSAQRFYINNELFKQAKSGEESDHYNQFVGNLIDECKSWNQGTVRKLLIASGINEENSLAYLSYMQHFGAPTPLLDYTFDPYMALFFATDNANYTASNNEIDNYFSIYYTYQNATGFEAWKEVFNNKDGVFKDGAISYEAISNNSMHILLPTDEAYKILNNTNIINQRGLFFYNNNPFTPLEQTYLEYSSFMKEQLGEAKFKEALMLDTFSSCFNIHKSFIPYIREKLDEKGITADYMYPDAYKMKTEASRKASIKSLVIKR